MAALVTSPRFPSLLPCAVLVIATTLAYVRTFSVPFVFDDIAAITQNPSLAKFSTALFPPAGLSVTGRPLANLSLALNHAISGESVWSYHALNLALHLANTLLLFALVRRTLSRCSPARESRDRATGHIAFAAALLWSVHPLHTAAVTYVMQRTELLASLGFLGSLGAFACAASQTSNRSENRWLILSVVSSLVGLASKEVAVSIPLLVLLYDRTFVSGSCRAALRQRPRYYAALASTWLLLAGLVLGTDNRGASAGLASALPWTDYALTQLYAVPHYLRLVLWPAPLVFDYGTTLVSAPMLIVPGALVLLALLSATVVAWVRWPAVGFCGVCFFALLAPTSSVVPIATQTIAEHRLYLALALPAVLLAQALHRLLAHRTLFLVGPLAAALALATVARNADYRTALALWSDTVAKTPSNARAHYNLAVTLLANSPGRDPARAEVALAETLRLDPAHPFAAAKLGATRLELGRFVAAVAPLAAALRLQPDSFTLHAQLAAALISSGQTESALPHLAAAVRLAPTHAVARYNYGNALAQLGRYVEALAQFDEAARLDPTDPSARTNAARIRDYLHTAPR